MKKRRKLRKQPNNDSITSYVGEHGDRGIFQGELVDLRESNTRGDCAAYVVKKPKPNAELVKENGIYFWEWDE